MMKKKVPQVMSGDSVLGSKRSTLALAKVSAQLPVSDASLRQPKVLHKSSGTDSHLRIANGKRIKLLHDLSSDDTQPTGSTTTKKMPKFDMNFSVLKEGDVTGDTPLFYLSDSDELPEPHELLRASVCGIGGTEEGLSVRTSDYSASHTDAVIRDGGTTQSETNAAETHDASTSSHTRYIESILPLKRKGSTDLGEDCTSFTITRAEATPPPPPPLSRCLQPQVCICKWHNFSL
ncbi:hypothetical protein B0F90DRAFT_802667 [Multifurca ochricompacta]|uniref:Uncharacterized protein n=1 Tax=Multifurca ochricompacta TaxID=376703 RepID=A0AAD4MAS9_9AGAM|nr:hypothetical protein B0F90DRAFT_802667 [Multifurca ochricompacta]